MAGGYLRGVLGWVEGRNVVFEHRYAEPERYPVLAAELVRLGVDIVVAPSTPAALAVRQATATIPIVTTVTVDPVGAGLVTSLAHPNGTSPAWPTLQGRSSERSCCNSITHARTIAAFATRDRLPTIARVREFAGASTRFFKGTKPGDLPIEQPTKFELAIDLRTAKALGLSVPHSLLARTDRVIEQ